MRVFCSAVRVSLKVTEKKGISYRGGSKIKWYWKYFYQGIFYRDGSKLKS